MRQDEMNCESVLGSQEGKGADPAERFTGV